MQQVISSSDYISRLNPREAEKDFLQLHFSSAWMQEVNKKSVIKYLGVQIEALSEYLPIWVVQSSKNVENAIQIVQRLIGDKGIS